MKEPHEVLDVLLQHPAVHVYGIADVEQFWDRSRWYRHGAAVLGVIDLPGSDDDVVYAVSADADGATIDLLDDLAGELPDRLVLHGPIGATTQLRRSGFEPSFRHDCRKMHLARIDLLFPPDDRVRGLDRNDVEAVSALFDADPLAGDFFHAGLLDSGWYVGLDADGALAAVAGIHVISTAHRVAAVANVATHPGFRRQGAGAAVVSALCRRLLAEVDTIGLNVRQDNSGAAALYHRLGFEPLVAYEEAALARA